MLPEDTQPAAGHWPSPLDTDAVFARPGVPQFPERVGDAVYWVQSLPEEGGRQVVKRRDAAGSIHVLTPAGLNVRTRVHEYGGCCHTFDEQRCWFVNFGDQRLYVQDLARTDAEPVTAEPAAGSGWMLADLCLHPDGRWLLAIGERIAAANETENRNAVVAIDLAAGGSERPIHVLVSGRDFYAAPTVSSDGRQLAFMGWDHPHMPWQSADITQADFDVLLNAALAGEAAADDALTRVDGGRGAAACQPVYRDDGSLLYACDRDGGDDPADNFWNLHTAGNGQVRRLTDDRIEYGAAHWVFGHRQLCPLDDGEVLAAGLSATGGVLRRIDLNGNGQVVAGSESFSGFTQLSPCRQGEILLMASSPDRDASVVAVDVARNVLSIVQAGDAVLEPADISHARAFSARSRDGVTLHAWHYPPVNRQVSATSLPPPPVMVLVHGGPTSRATAAFNPAVQFWTTRGIAVLDVNHRGSTGYGRHYRQALDGYWGVRDVDDVVDTLAGAAAAGLVDPERVFIRGGSAGGYVVLAALTRYPQTFLAGACYYGIGNLATLADATHKFESRYLDSLLGEAFDPARADDPDHVYYQRSPIHFLDRVISPMILFQGAEDRVVPPEVSREVVSQLEARGIPHRYIEYEGEGHGFRQAGNRVDALEAEARFLLDVMNSQKTPMA